MKSLNDMLVKIGNTWYDSKETPVVLIIDRAENERLARIAPGDRVIVAVPDNTTSKRYREIVDQGYQDYRKRRVVKR